MKVNARELEGLTVGIELVASVLLCVALGYQLDKHVHTGPWGVLGGAALGMAAGFRSAWRVLKKQAKRDEAEDRKNDAIGRTPAAPPAEPPPAVTGDKSDEARP